MPIYVFRKKDHESWRNYEEAAERLVIVAPNLAVARELAMPTAPPLGGKGITRDAPPFHPWLNPDAHHIEILPGDETPRMVAIEQLGIRRSLALSD